MPPMRLADRAGWESHLFRILANFLEVLVELLNDEAHNRSVKLLFEGFTGRVSAENVGVQS